MSRRYLCPLSIFWCPHSQTLLELGDTTLTKNAKYSWPASSKWPKWRSLKIPEKVTNKNNPKRPWTEGASWVNWIEVQYLQHLKTVSSCWLNQPLWNTYDRQNGFIFPIFPGENKQQKYLKFHHPGCELGFIFWASATFVGENSSLPPPPLKEKICHDRQDSPRDDC